MNKIITLQSFEDLLERINETNIESEKNLSRIKIYKDDSNIYHLERILFTNSAYTNIFVADHARFENNQFRDVIDGLLSKEKRFRGEISGYYKSVFKQEFSDLSKIKWEEENFDNLFLNLIMDNEYKLRTCIINKVHICYNG